MASTYKTPGVYIEEISKFPASIAQVPTAIPAFVGFTGAGFNALDIKPVKIKSLLEYEAQFGGEATGANRTIAVTVDASGNPSGASLSSRFLLYQSLRLFYANGGGDAYIVSAGDYTTAAGATSRDALIGAIDALKKADEPTLVVIPDAWGLNSAGDAGQVHKKMLEHCNNMQDRFAIMDVWHDSLLGTNIPSGDATAFRTGAGTQYLKYGAAYYPELNTILGPNGAIDPTSFTLNNGAPTTLEAEGIAAGDQGIINYYNSADDLVVLGNAFAGYAGSKTMTALQADWAAAYVPVYAGNDTDARAHLISLIEILGGMAQLIYAYNPAPTFTATPVSNLKNAIVAVGGALEAEVEKLYSLHEEYESATITSLGGAAAALGVMVPADFNDAGFDYELASVPAAVTNPYEDGGVPADVAAAVNKVNDDLDAIHTALIDLYDQLHSTAQNLNSLDTLLATSKVYSAIVAKIRNTGYTLPPSGAMAGVYAATDRNRGVWKAPANLSLVAVESVGRKMQDSELDDLNIPADGQGKSINAIRFFRGKGILVYGARTLAGNDNEWRYVPVRRLFIMVEESVKKATEQMIFEPNDAGTWQKVRAMIGNFLTGLWRDGGIVGAAPEDAFFVKCGLGETMSPQDILEGKLIVEIGMAAVRPAEFIILKFSHKMQES